MKVLKRLMNKGGIDTQKKEENNNVQGKENMESAKMENEKV